MRQRTCQSCEWSRRWYGISCFNLGNGDCEGEAYIYIYSPTIASHQRQELIVERMQSGKKLWRFSSFFLFFFFSLATREAFLFVSFSLESVYGNCTGMVEKNWIIVWLDGIFWCSNECTVFGFVARKLILLDNRFVVFCNQFEIKERILLILY